MSLYGLRTKELRCGPKIKQRVVDTITTFLLVYPLSYTKTNIEEQN